MSDARKQRTLWKYSALSALIAVGTLPAVAQEKVAQVSGAVMAIATSTGKGVRQGELFSSGSEPASLVTRANLRAELSPHSVAEFDAQGSLRLLRGSMVVTAQQESNVSTASARLEMVGRAILSYDHKERSTSAFVLEGEGRLVNPQHADRTLRLAHFRGATMVVGEVLPQLVRQLDVGAVHAWLKGFAWPENRRKAILRGMPGEVITAGAEAPEHLAKTKIEDYFSSIDTADEFHQPDYYDKKFADPDRAVAEANSEQGSGKRLTPEEAALISLPKTKIDLGFDLSPEFLTVSEKDKEVRQLDPQKKAPARKLASVVPARPRAGPVQKPSEPIFTDGEAEVSLVLSRLRGVRSEVVPTSRQLPAGGRSPASVPVVIVPDPVHDYSQNF